MIIYKAINLINNKIYIGQTIISLSERKGDHRRKSLIHSSTTYFHNAIRKYGFNNFSWVIIDIADNINKLNTKEEFWIKYYNSTDKKYGYNLSSGGLNKKTNLSTKIKISQIQKGIKRSKEFKEKISLVTKGSKNPFYGKKHSEETRKKISETKKNQKLKATKEHIEKCIMRGERNGRTTITTQQAIKIKIMIKDNIPNKNIMEKFNISKNCFQAIKHNHTWKHIKV
jgi:group I intron endonuclease